MHRIACVVGTRPEAIKMAPLVRLLKEDGRFAVTVLASGQHSDMLQQALAHFRIAAAGLPFLRADPGGCGEPEARGSA